MFKIWMKQGEEVRKKEEKRTGRIISRAMDSLDRQSKRKEIVKRASDEFSLRHVEHV